MEKLQDKVTLLQKESNTRSVEAALHILQRELRKPKGIFEPHAALAALENLADISRDNVDPTAPRYNTIYKQCRPLLYNPHFQSVLLKLVGDKQDVEVAEVIEKTHQSPPRSPYTQFPEPPTQFQRFRPFFIGRRSPVRCFNCNAMGHFARVCPGQQTNTLNP